MSKSKAYSPAMSATQREVAQQMNLPSDVASKAVGTLQVSKFKTIVERGIDYHEDYADHKVSCKLQDAAIARAAAEADRVAQREHSQFMALADLEDNAALSEDERILLGVKTPDEIRESAAVSDEITRLKQQLADLKSKVAEESGETTATQDEEVMPS